MSTFLGAKISVFIFQVLKFQSTSQVLLFSTSLIFYFVLVSMKYLIYSQMLSKKHIFGSEKRKKNEMKS